MPSDSMSGTIREGLERIERGEMTQEQLMERLQAAHREKNDGAFYIYVTGDKEPVDQLLAEITAISSAARKQPFMELKDGRMDYGISVPADAPEDKITEIIREAATRPALTGFSAHRIRREGNVPIL